MTNKYDLNTYALRNAAVSMISNIGGQIPAGKTRFLTFIRVERLAGQDPGDPASFIEVAVGSCVTGAADIVNAGSVASYHAKLILKIESAATVDMELDSFRKEVRGSADNPILSVAGGNYMLVAFRESASAAVFAQYFDE